MRHFETRGEWIDLRGTFVLQVEEMNAWSPIAWITLGASLVASLALIIYAIRKALVAKNSAQPSRPPSISCLLCGRKNKITNKEWEKSSLTCACGQMLYLSSSGLERIIP